MNPEEIPFKLLKVSQSGVGSRMILEVAAGIPAVRDFEPHEFVPAEYTPERDQSDDL